MSLNPRAMSDVADFVVIKGRNRLYIYHPDYLEYSDTKCAHYVARVVSGNGIKEVWHLVKPIMTLSELVMLLQSQKSLVGSRRASGFIGALMNAVDGYQYFVDLDKYRLCTEKNVPKILRELDIRTVTKLRLVEVGNGVYVRELSDKWLVGYSDRAYYRRILDYLISVPKQLDYEKLAGLAKFYYEEIELFEELASRLEARKPELAEVFRSIVLFLKLAGVGNG